MTERFLQCLKFVLKWEGGLSDDPDDPGGRTYRGVTQARYDQYRREKGLPLQDVAKMTEAEMREIYYFYYWQPSKAGLLPIPLDLIVFDTAVNMGVKTSAILLQRALNSLLPQDSWIPVDGVIGQKTLAAISWAVKLKGMQALCDAYLQRREERYRAIVRANPRLGKFLKGWLNRLNDLRKEVRKYLGR